MIPLPLRRPAGARFWMTLISMILLSGLPNRGGAEEDYPRNPFWPVGYRPARVAQQAGSLAGAAARAAEEAVRLERARQAARNRISIQGISRRRDGLTVALINDRLVEPGEVVTVTLDGEAFAWRVKAIDLIGVDLEPILEPSNVAPEDARKETP